MLSHCNIVAPLDSMTSRAVPDPVGSEMDCNIVAPLDSMTRGLKVFDEARDFIRRYMLHRLTR